MSPEVLQNYLGLPVPDAFHFQTWDSSPTAPALALRVCLWRDLGRARKTREGWGQV